MNKIRVRKIWELLIESTYLGVVFLLPLFFSIIPKTANVFDLNKTILFRVLVLFLTLSYLFGVLFIEGVFKDFVNTLKTRGRYLIVPLLFLASLVLITFSSDFSGLSFWGLYERQMGLYSYIYFLLFFSLLFFYVKKNAQLNKILFAISLSSFLVCIYGLIQAVGADPLSWAESTHARISSTIGQTNFLIKLG